MRYLNFTLLLIIIINIFAADLSGQERKKLAQTGLKFLSIPLDARASGFGDAITAVELFSASMLYNPSAMANLDNTALISFGTTRWIADINYIYGTAAMNLFDGDYGVFGISMVAVDYGEFQGTVFAPNDDGYLDVGTYEPKAYAFGISYAKQLSEKFSVGGGARYVKQSIGTAVIGIGEQGEALSKDYKIDAFAFDFGVLYLTGFRSLTFGMSIRNFSTEIEYEEESFQLPLTFRIGLSMDAMDLFEADREMHSFIVAVDAAHPRDFPEQIFIGGEYTFLKTLSLRAGYSFPNDEQEYTLGLGLMQNFQSYRIAIDYAYTPFGIFSDVHRISVNFGL
jgi:hypothetical protein